MQTDAFGEDATGRSAVLGSETRKSFPPVPPTPPPPLKKRYVTVVAVAIATGILVVGSLMLFVGTAPGDAEPEVAADADAVESELAPPPTVITTPRIGTSPLSDPGRISAIVADAHSGRYFSNKFEDTYPKAVEIALVTGMARTTADNLTVTDAVLACSLSYLETHLSSMELIKRDPKSTEKIGVKAGFACLDYHL
jgi:hypothetical protein